MTIAYRPKDISDLQWRSIVDEVRSEMQKLQRRVLYSALNSVLSDVNTEYIAALQNGEVLAYEADTEQLKRVLVQHTLSELGI